MPVDQRQDIRVRMRRKRGDVDPADGKTAAMDLCRRLKTCDFFDSAKHIAAYFPNDGEIDCWPVIELAWEKSKHVYLPVLQPGNTLAFARISAQTPLRKNRYGIQQPQYSESDLIAPANLDLVLMPMVAFDDALFRLGMGGGYYDRTFAFVSNAAKTQPVLVAIGYDFQRVDSVCPETWDIPACSIVTDKTIYKEE